MGVIIFMSLLYSHKTLNLAKHAAAAVRFRSDHLNGIILAWTLTNEILCSFVGKIFLFPPFPVKSWDLTSTAYPTPTCVFETLGLNVECELKWRFKIYGNWVRVLLTTNIYQSQEEAKKIFIKLSGRRVAPPAVSGETLRVRDVRLFCHSVAADLMSHTFTCENSDFDI